jgi:hypothetical protein
MNGRPSKVAGLSMVCAMLLAQEYLLCLNCGIIPSDIVGFIVDPRLRIILAILLFFAAIRLALFESKVALGLMIFAISIAFVGDAILLGNHFLRSSAVAAWHRTLALSLGILFSGFLLLRCLQLFRPELKKNSE